MADIFFAPTDPNGKSHRFVSRSMRISSSIVHLMREQDISKEEFCERLQVTRHKFRSYLGGVHEFTLREIAAIEELFKVDLIEAIKHAPDFDPEKNSAE